MWYTVPIDRRRVAVFTGQQPLPLGDKMDKPNCYKCKYRGNLPGDCHSVCEHPAIKDQFISVIIPPPELNIKGNRHGIDHGWFWWPINFDPIWLERCDGFTPIS